MSGNRAPGPLDRAVQPLPALDTGSEATCCSPPHSQRKCRKGGLPQRAGHPEVAQGAAHTPAVGRQARHVRSHIPLQTVPITPQAPSLDGGLSQAWGGTWVLGAAEEEKVGTCPGWGLSRLERHPVHQEVAGSILGEGTHLGCRFDPLPGHVVDRLVSPSPPSMFLSLSLSLHPPPSLPPFLSVYSQYIYVLG